MKPLFHFTGAGMLALLLVLLATGAVFAEGETPPEVTAPATDAEPVSEEIAVEDPPEVDAPSAEEIFTDEAAAANDPEEVELIPAEDTSLAEDTSALVEAELILADESGEPLDMASQASAELLAEPDPYFTVGTTTYRFFSGAGVCAAQYPGDLFCFDNQGANVIQDALNYIQANGTIPTDKKIYVESGTYGVANVHVDGANPNMSTINGIIGLNTTGTRPVINGSVEIENLAGGFTLSGFTINGQVWVHDAAGLLVLENLKVTNTTGTGINVDNFAGEVRLKDIDSSNNVGYGTVINNTAGTGKVTITHAKFDENNNGAAGQTYGLRLTSRGAITLDGVSASKNEGPGIYIYDQTSTVTIKNSTAIDNEYTTAYGISRGIYIASGGSGAITLDNIITSGHDRAHGIYISTAGAVTVKNLISHDNYYSGLNIDATAGTGAVKVTNGDFAGNGAGGFSGLNIYAKGNVTLETVRSDDNGQDGAFIDNCQWDGLVCTGTGTVTVTSLASAGSMAANHFNGNSMSGLEIISGKSVAINNIIADGNTHHGVWVRHIYSTSPASVKVTLPVTDYENFSNQFTNNGRYGLYMQGTGAFTVDRFYAENNTWSGLYLENYNAVGTPGATISNGASNDNGNDGIMIESKGNVTITNVSASGNDYGLVVGLNYGRVGTVTIKTTGGKVNTFNNNGFQGVYILANGAITANNISASENFNTNVYLNNAGATSTAGIIVQNGYFFKSTNDHGLYVYSKGKISVRDVEAVENDDHGVALYNYDGLAAVDITNAVLNSNGYTGLVITSYRSVTINNLQANFNGDYGANLDTCNWDGAVCRGSGNITISATSAQRNEFIGNTYQGLYAYASGNISLKNFTAQDNDFDGIYLFNNWDGYSGSVTISGYAAKPNRAAKNGLTYMGIRISSNGTVNVSQTIAEDNYSYGMMIDNDTSGTPKPVTVSDSIFNHNQNTGLYIYSNGLVTLSGVEASHNSIYTGVIYNWAGTVYDHLSRDINLQPDEWKFTGSGLVTINLTSNDFDAYLELRSKTDSLLASDNNSGGGTNASIINYNLGGAADDFYVIVKDANGTAGGSYTISLSLFGGGTSYSILGVQINSSGASSGVVIKPNAKGIGLVADDNGSNGLNVSTDGAITLSKVWASGNLDDNLYLYNNNPAGKNISLSYVYASQSDNHPMYQSQGIAIDTRGSVTIKNGYANQNGDDGVSINGISSSFYNAVSISNFEMNENLGNRGLFIQTLGPVTLSSVKVNNNSHAAQGAYIDNCYWAGACLGSGDIVISGNNNQFNNNSGQGLLVMTAGKFSFSNFSASGNSSDGINAFSYAVDGGTSYIKNTVAKQFNQVNDNGGRGINLTFSGLLNISRVSAINNMGYNMVVDNSSGSLPHTAVISNSIFNGSQSNDGLNLTCNGAVTLTNLQANDNIWNGISVANTASTAPQTITASQIKTNGNSDYGFVVASKGDVLLTNIQACSNDADGLYVNNSYGAGKLTIKSTSDNLFIGNGGSGISADVGGAIWLERIQAIANHSDGIGLTHDAGKTGAVTIKKVIALSNGREGLDLAVRGAVYMENINAMGNGSSGNYHGIMVVSNSNPMTIKNSVVIGNTGSGLDTWLGGQTLTLVNTYYYGNDTNNTGDPDWFDH